MSVNTDAYHILRGLYCANKIQDKNAETPVIDLADERANIIEIESGITVALEDFSKKFKSFNGYNCSNITAKDAKENKTSEKSNNIFASEEGQKILKNMERCTQHDIYQQEVNKYGGIQYGITDWDNQALITFDDRLRSGALNFAKADIEAIEKPYDESKWFHENDGKLDEEELYSAMPDVEDIKDAIANIDLDGDKETISFGEYASYMLAADSNLDGIVTNKEISDILHETPEEDFYSAAKKMYNNYFNF